MNKDLKNIIASDINRGYNDRILNRPLELKYLITWRKAAYYGKNHPLGIWYRFRLKCLSHKSGIQIPTNTKIGKGFFIAHFGTIIINPAVTMGDNINIAPGVVIGKANRGRRKGVPIIGNDVLIAPNSFVNTDVQDHSIVIGNPAVIHHRAEATKDYINNRV